MSRGELLMNIDKKFESAEFLCKRLYNCSRNEWKNWINYFKENGWVKSLKFAECLKESNMLRFNQKQSYNQIFNVMRNYQNQLPKPIDLAEILEIFGYVSWKLVISEYEKKEKSNKYKKSKKYKKKNYYTRK